MLIIDAAEGQYKHLFNLHFNSEMRFEELAGLFVEDLDFASNTIHIRGSTFRTKDVTPKTDAGYRDVKVDSDTMKDLKQFLGNRQSGRISQSRNKTPLVHGNVNRYVLKPLCRKLNIPIATTHAFRHGRISILQQNRVPGDLIKEWVGDTIRTLPQVCRFESGTSNLLWYQGFPGSFFRGQFRLELFHAGRGTGPEELTWCRSTGVFCFRF